MQIQQLDLTQFHQVSHLFSKDDTNLPAALGVIEGSLPGSIWVDTTDAPSVCLVLCNDAYCLISGKLTQSLLEAFLPLIRQKRIVRLQCPPKTHNNTLDLAQYGFVPLARREYHYNSKTLLHIPNSSAFELKPIDNALLFDACMWKPLMLDIYQNFNHYLQHAIGFVLWDPLTKRVVSETHGVGADQLMEIATVTHPDYQNKQLASIICNHLINTRMQAGKNTIWSCDEHNIASGKVAEKQGMAEMIPYDFYIYKRI